MFVKVANIPKALAVALAGRRNLAIFDQPPEICRRGADIRRRIRRLHKARPRMDGGLPGHGGSRGAWGGRDSLSTVPAHHQKAPLRRTGTLTVEAAAAATATPTLGLAPESSSMVTFFAVASQ